MNEPPGIGAKKTQADLSAEAASAASVFAKADVAQLAERVLGKDEVTGSIPVIGSRTLHRTGSTRRVLITETESNGEGKI